MRDGQQIPQDSSNEALESVNQWFVLVATNLIEAAGFENLRDRLLGECLGVGEISIADSHREQPFAVRDMRDQSSR